MEIKLKNITVEFLDSMLEKIKNYTQNEGENETGGILLGGFIPEKNKYVITDVSVPNNSDDSGPCFFLRNYESAQRIINKYWRESAGRINYLGEWYTHGCKNPYPSLEDRKLLKMIISDKSNVWNEVFMLILGNNNSFYLGMAYKKDEEITIEGILVREE